jgi:hypothetical protein
MILPGNSAVRQVVVKGMANIGLAHTVPESGGFEDDIFIHGDSMAQLIPVFKMPQALFTLAFNKKRAIRKKERNKI